MNASEYEAAFRAECQVSPDVWDLVGFRVVPCRCGLRDCPGWQVVLPEGERPTTRLQRLRMAPSG